VRNRILLAIKFIISFGLIYYLLRHIGVQTVWHDLSSPRWSWILISIAACSLSNLLGAFQWQLLLRQAGIRFSYYRVMQYYHIGLFFNNFFISNMGGDFFRLFYIARHGNNSSAAVSTVFLDRFLGFTLLTVLAVIGSIYWIGSTGLTHILPVLLTLMILWGVIVLVFFNRRLGKLLRFLLKWFVPEKYLNKLKDIYNLVNDFLQNKRLVWSVVGISLVVQLLRIYVHFAVGRAIGVETSFISFMIYIPLIALLASLPISIGGLGIREQTGVILFQRVGIAKSMSLSMEFLAYLVTIVGSILGVFFFLGMRGQKESNDEE